LFYNKGKTKIVLCHIKIKLGAKLNKKPQQNLDVTFLKNIFFQPCPSLLSCSGYPVLAGLSWLSCPGFDVLALVSLLLCTGVFYHSLIVL
jgi:hypothetical protein